MRRSFVPAPSLEISVLVADDEPLVASAMRRILARRGITAVVVSNGHDALRACASGSIALVFADAHMPGPAGAELARALRSMLGSAAPPVVVVSGDVALLPSQRCGTAGMIAKPFEAADLLAYVARLPRLTKPMPPHAA
jgi:CheY-like chemotaxis protein